MTETSKKLPKLLFSTLQVSEKEPKPENEKPNEKLSSVSGSLELGGPIRLGAKAGRTRRVEQELITLPLDKCRECPLKGSPSIRHNYRGSLKAKVLFMGEAPGETEEKVGEVFRGKSGKLLSAMLEETGYSEDDEVFICNTLLCRPPDNRDPKSPELKCCRSNIEAIISAVSPEVVVPLGNFALKWLTKRTGVMTWHGSKMQSDYGTVIPAIHPAFALRQGARIHPRNKEEQQEGIRGFIVTDLEYIRSVIEETEEEFETRVAKNFNYRLTLEIEDLEELFQEIESHEHIAVDIETTGLSFYRDQIIGIAFSWAEGQGVYVPLQTQLDDLICEDIQGVPIEGEEFFPLHPRLTGLHSIYSRLRSLGNVIGVSSEGNSKGTAGDTGCLSKDAAEAPGYTHPVLEEWRAKRKKKKKKATGEKLVKFWGNSQNDVEELIGCIMRLPGKRWCGWNFKFDEKFLATHFGTGIFRTDGDGLFQAYLLDENTPNDLKSNTDRNIPEMRGYANELRRHTSQSQLDDEKLAHVPLPVLYKYGCGDADATLRLVLQQGEKLAKFPKLETYYKDFYIELMHAYTAAEIDGIRVDHEWVTKVAIDLVEKIDKADQEMFDMVGQEFNPNSNPQVVEVLYGPDSYFKLEVPADKHLLTDSGLPSVKELVLKHFFYKESVDPELARFIRLQLEHVKLSKQMSTYIVGCTEELDHFGRAHFSTNMIGAVTGRMSVKKIPIQTIPRGPLIRGMFLSAPGWKLIEADYKAQELRIAAWYSQDATMKWEFDNNEDPHLNTGAEMFKCDNNQVTDHQRKLAKSTNFGCLFEGGPLTLADSINDRLELDDTPVTVADTERFQEAWAKRYRGFVTWRFKVHSKVKKDAFVVSPLGRIRRLPAIHSEEQKDRAEAMRQGVNALIQGLGTDIGELALARILPRFQEEKLQARFRWSLHDALFVEAPDPEVVRVCEIMKEEMEKEIVDGLYTPVEFKVFEERWAGEHIEDDGNLDKIRETYAQYQDDDVKPFDSMLTD